MPDGIRMCRWSRMSEGDRRRRADCTWPRGEEGVVGGLEQRRGMIWLQAGCCVVDSRAESRKKLETEMEAPVRAMMAACTRV